MQGEEILIGCFVACQSIKKVGGRRSVEGLYQPLFFECKDKRTFVCNESNTVLYFSLDTTKLAQNIVTRSRTF